MLREETAAEQAFRAEARSWLEASLPRELRNTNNRLTPNELKGWFKTLGEKGWAAPHWPKEHGGIVRPSSNQVESPSSGKPIRKQMARALGGPWRGRLGA